MPTVFDRSGNGWFAPDKPLVSGDDGVGNGAFAVTAADADLSQKARGLFIGTTGDVKVTTVYGHTVTFKNVPSGSILPVACSRVWAATTAADIIGLY